jgi:hypothetical protein
MNEIEKQFCAELKALLEKYDATLSVRDFTERGGGLRYKIEAYSSSVIKDWEIVREGIEVNLGEYVDAGNIKIS